MTSHICWSCQAGTMEPVLWEKRGSHRAWRLGTGGRRGSPGSGLRGGRAGHSCGTRSSSALDMLGPLKPQFSHLPSGDPLLKGKMTVLDGGWERPWQGLWCRAHTRVSGDFERRAFHRAPSQACAVALASRASAPGHLRTPSSPPSRSHPLGQSSGCRLRPGEDSVRLGRGRRWPGELGGPSAGGLLR